MGGGGRITVNTLDLFSQEIWGQDPSALTLNILRDKMEYNTKLKVGDWVNCLNCDDVHRLHGSELSSGETTSAILTYKCGDNVCVARWSCMDYVKPIKERTNE